MKYYSEHTEELYDSIEELEQAETNLAKENLRKAQIEEQKIMRQKEVANAYEAAREAYKYANELRKKFCEDYGYYCTSETKTVNHKDLTDFFSLFFK